MSGGHFDYRQHHIIDLISGIEEAIKRNVTDEWAFTAATLDEFRRAVMTLRAALVYTNRIDWLLSGDDGEDSFHERLAADLAELRK